MITLSTNTSCTLYHRTCDLKVQFIKDTKEVTAGRKVIAAPSFLFILCHLIHGNSSYEFYWKLKICSTLTRPIRDARGDLLDVACKNLTELLCDAKNNDKRGRIKRIPTDSSSKEGCAAFCPLLDICFIKSDQISIASASRSSFAQFLSNIRLRGAKTNAWGQWLDAWFHRVNKTFLEQLNWTHDLRSP